MSKVKLEYTGNLDYVPVTDAVVTTGWYPGNVGQLSSAGKLQKYAGSGEDLYIIIDTPTELSAPPTGKMVTTLHGNGKISIIPASVSDWPNVYALTLPEWEEDMIIYATSDARLTVGYNASATAESGSMKVGKVITPPTAGNDYTLTMNLAESLGSR